MINTKSANVALVFAFFMVGAVRAGAQVPGILGHQGKLTIHGTNFTGVCQFKFALIATNASGLESTLWSHDGTSKDGSEPAGQPVQLPVTRGIFSVNLGDVSIANMAQPIPSSVFTNEAVFLRTWVNDGVNGSQQLVPDRRITSVGHALVASQLLNGGSTLNKVPSATNFSGTLSGDVTGAQKSTVVAMVSGVTAANVAAGATAANAATPANAPNTVVRRDASGNFSAGLITGFFAGDGSMLTNLMAPGGTNFTGTLAGDVTGAQKSTVVAVVGGVSAANVATGAAAANAATSTSTPNTIVRRDASGNFSANRISGAFAGTFSGDGSMLTNMPAPSGAILASVQARDPALIAAGYRQIITIPAPAWVNGATSNAPAARFGHAAIFDGQRMIVWGGTTAGGSSTASGGMYDVGADTWTTTSPINAPSARTGHTAVWTGTEMIIWGGQGSSSYLLSGARFVPAAQTWTAISTIGAPSAREGHIAVWTGSKMVIWGGYNFSGMLNDGAIYDPVANQWTALVLTNAPEARSGAAAVWANDRMLVWGGEGSLGDLNTGAQLVFTNGEPAAWLTMTTSNAPAGRSHHCAVWTGDKMLVWGGRSGLLPLGDGAAFTTNDQWIKLSATNTASPRYDFAAVWTGTELLVVGGANASSELAASAAYSTDSLAWRALSNLGGPLARSLPTAIWTGTEVVLFGGQVGGQPVAGLQRLSPQPAWYFYRKL